MKTSTFLASVLLSSLAAAAPLDRRAARTKTEIVTTTVFSTVTVYDDEPAPTSSQGLFYEQPASASSVAASSTAIYVAPAPSSPAAAPQSSAPSVVPAAAPATSASVVEQPAATSAPAAPAVTSTAPVVSAAPVTSPTSAAPAAPVYSQPASSSPSTGSGTQYSGDLTMYNSYGGYGACGTLLDDSKDYAAIGKNVWGASTHDLATGASTNPWCGRMIAITANGVTVNAPVVDRCDGCTGQDVDASPALYKKLGLDSAAPGRSSVTWTTVS